MTPLVLFIVGPPAAGKSTLVREMLRILWTTDEKRRRFRNYKHPKHTMLGSEVCAAGVYNWHYSDPTPGPFEGADVVGYSQVYPWIESWRRTDPLPSLTLLDGDRFSHVKARDMFYEAGASVECVYVWTDRLVERQAARTQNLSWAKGRTTKAIRFFETFAADRDFAPEGACRASGDLPPQDEAMRLLRAWAPELL